MSSFVFSILLIWWLVYTANILWDCYEIYHQFGYVNTSRLYHRQWWFIILTCKCNNRWLEKMQMAPRGRPNLQFALGLEDKLIYFLFQYILDRNNCFLSAKTELGAKLTWQILANDLPFKLYLRLVAIGKTSLFSSQTSHIISSTGIILNTNTLLISDTAGPPVIVTVGMLIND